MGDLNDRKKRSVRFRIAMRPDGNDDNPRPETRSSQFGDPVNFFFPVTDKDEAESARVEFLDAKGVYQEADEDQFFVNSIRVIIGRLNRLLRKFNVKEIPNSAVLSLSMPSLPGPIYLTGQVLPYKDTGDVLIPAARIATHKHPWYGTLYHDEDFFESMIDNFETDVLRNEAVVNTDHGGGQGLAWTKRLFLGEDKSGQGVFYVLAEPTDHGRGQLGETLKFASIEYWDGFTDSETLFSYGPVFGGVAATNNPFVRGNQPINFVPPGSLDSAFSDKRERKFYNLTGGNRMKEKVKLGEREYTVEELTALVARGEAQAAEIRANRIALTRTTAETRLVAPAIVNYVTGLMAQLSPEAAKTLTIIETNEDGERQAKVNLFGAMETLLAIVPGRSAAETTTNAEGLIVERPTITADASEGDATAHAGSDVYLSETDMAPEVAEAAAIARREELNGK